ncbi:hypothetical protein CEXT_785561 [Caerostris extrusa]|uniref:Uncharacterized protein n=1 Tax=Caerostris extrusa TaxID=172846 RepID=A0AAV4MJU4_CAEEX|nr:hypothetical protein CEXT_785561 [Caerostris extrusa]
MGESPCAPFLRPRDKSFHEVWRDRERRVLRVCEGSNTPPCYPWREILLEAPDHGTTLEKGFTGTVSGDYIGRNNVTLLGDTLSLPVHRSAATNCPAASVPSLCPAGRGQRTATLKKKKEMSERRKKVVG